MNNNVVIFHTFHELLNMVSFEKVFEYMKETYPCQRDEDKYRALFEGYKRLSPIMSSNAPLEVYFSSIEDADDAVIESWAEPYVLASNRGFHPTNWYTFSEDISEKNPQEVLGLTVKDDGEESYSYLLGTMLWEMNWQLHLHSGNITDVNLAQSEIEQGQYIEWPAKDALILCEDEDMPFLLRDDTALGNIVTNKTQNVLYDNSTKRLITKEWYEHIDYTYNPDIYIVFKSAADKSGNRVTLRNLLNANTGDLLLDSWVNDVMWLEHLKIFGILRDGRWNAFDIEQKRFVLKEDVDGLQRMSITTC